MPTNCEITFEENWQGTYFSGQKVSGKVVLTLDKQKTVKGIVLKICGYAETNWRQGNRRRHGKEGRRRMFQGRVDYLASTTYLVGSEDNANQINIKCGTHTYNFHCTIPELCPSSFESGTGHIRYVAKVIVLRTNNIDKTFSIAFTVVKQLDLNKETAVIKGPLTAETVKMLSVGFFGKKPLILSAEIPQNGFIPGESIMVDTRIANQSNTPLKGVRFALNLVATFQSQTPRPETRIEKINLCKVKSGPVDKQSTINFMEILKVPPTPPSCLDLCNIIRISYEVDVMAKISGVLLSPSVVIPIIIGTIPLAASEHSVIQRSKIALQKEIEADTSHQKAMEIARSLASVNLDLPSTTVQSTVSSVPPALASQRAEPLIDSEHGGLPPSYDEAMALPTQLKTLDKKQEEDSDSEIEILENDEDDDNGEDEDVEVVGGVLEPVYPVLEMGILVEVDVDNSKEKKYESKLVNNQ